MAKQIQPGRAPVSLAPVKALSENKPIPAVAPVVPKVPEAKPLDLKPLDLKPVAPIAPAPAPAPIAPAARAPEPVKAQPVLPEPAKSEPAKVAPVVAAPAPVAVPAKVVPPANEAPAKAPLATAPLAKEQPVKAAAPVGRPKGAKTKVAGKAPAVAKVAAVAASVPAKSVEPVVAKSEAVKSEAKPVAVAVAVAPSPKPAAVVAPAAATAPKSVLASVPKLPQFAAVSAGTLFDQTLIFTRAFGAMQAKVLDHACDELKATLGEIETLARTNSAADAVALQAKAFRRSVESLSAHLTDLAATARRELPRG